MKKVLTLTDILFTEACHELAEKIKRDKFVPTLVIGIASGGVYVLANLDFDNAQKLEVVQRRPSTEKKQKSSLTFLFKYVPYWILNIARNFESWYLELRPAERDHKSMREIAKQLDSKLIKSHKNILVVDDAVDSGVTLNAVTLAVDSVCSEGAQIKTAVLTVTNEDPIMKPDYFLHTEVLLRFPWSNDFRG